MKKKQQSKLSKISVGIATASLGSALLFGGAGTHDAQAAENSTVQANTNTSGNFNLKYRENPELTHEEYKLLREAETGGKYIGDGPSFKAVAPFSPYVILGNSHLSSDQYSYLADLAHIDDNYYHSANAEPLRLTAIEWDATKRDGGIKESEANQPAPAKAEPKKEEPKASQPEPTKTEPKKDVKGKDAVKAEPKKDVKGKDAVKEEPKKDVKGKDAAKDKAKTDKKCDGVAKDQPKKDTTGKEAVKEQPKTDVKAAAPAKEQPKAEAKANETSKAQAPAATPTSAKAETKAQKSKEGAKELPATGETNIVVYGVLFGSILAIAGSLFLKRRRNEN